MSRAALSGCVLAGCILVGSLSLAFFASPAGLALAAGTDGAVGPRPGAAAWVWMVGGLGLAGLAYGFVRMKDLAARISLADQIWVALTGALALLVLSVAGFLLRIPTTLLLGPFHFLLEGLVFKFLLFLLLGAVFSQVRRPGVFLLFYMLWMVAQALLQGHFSPATVLHAGVTVSAVEGALWVSGLTRGREPANFWPALWVGAALAASVFWGLKLFAGLYRLHFADWYIAAQTLTEGLYAAGGTWVGLGLGARMGSVRRPQVLERPLSRQEIRRPAVSYAGPVPAMGEPIMEPNRELLLDLYLPTYSYTGASPTLWRDLRLGLAPGQIVIVTGDSGCGKTTLLRLVKGLLPWPAGARPSWRGQPLDETAPSQMTGEIALLFQEPALQMLRPDVLGEVSWGAQRRGLTPEAARSAAMNALEVFRAGGLAGRRVSELSGGELQSVALAAQWITNPRVLLLDEPLAHLDRDARANLLEQLPRLAETGCAIVVAEHRLAQLLPLAHKVLLLTPNQSPWQGSGGAFRARFPERLAGGGRTSRTAQATASAWDSAESMPGPFLMALEGVTHRMNRRGEPVLRDVTARLPSGRAVALTGANGAGKSTLFTLALGLRRPTRGRVWLKQRPAHGLSMSERGRLCGYLPQAAEVVLQASTVAEELAQGLRWRGLGEDEIQRRVTGWLEQLGLAGRGGSYPHNLSRGERLRLALGVVMIGEPQLLLLDEPFAAQDPDNCARVMELCRSFLAELPGRGLVIATHEKLDPGEMIEGPLNGLFDAEWRLADGGLIVRNLAGQGPGARPEAARAVSAVGGGP